MIFEKTNGPNYLVSRRAGGARLDRCLSVIGLGKQVQVDGAWVAGRGIRTVIREHGRQRNG